MSPPLPIRLRQIDASALPSLPLPTQKIHTDADIEVWRRTSGYADYMLFLKGLNEAVVDIELGWTPPFEIEAITKTLALLDTLDKWINEIPPEPTPQRFGNLAFRVWGKRLHDNAPALLQTLLPAHLQPAIPHITPYLLTAFGSFTRMDYGTGHETAWALFMCCLSLVRFFPFASSPPSNPPPDSRSERDADEDLALSRALVLTIFPRYVALTWRLQDAYRLEPAGSHGVWGLDDSSFLGYYWGSAQMRNSHLSPSTILSPPLPPLSLYHTHITRILALKTGSFHEHSSQLYSIAVGVKWWAKVNSGLGKMYEAEVLGKRVVVQHIPLGGILAWDPPDPPSSSYLTSPTTNSNANWNSNPTSISVLTPSLPPLSSRVRTGWKIPAVSKTTDKEKNKNTSGAATATGTKAWVPPAVPDGAKTTRAPRTQPQPPQEASPFPTRGPPRTTNNSGAGHIPGWDTWESRSRVAGGGEGGGVRAFWGAPDKGDTRSASGMRDASAPGMVAPAFDAGSGTCAPWATDRFAQGGGAAGSGTGAVEAGGARVPTTPHGEGNKSTNGKETGEPRLEIAGWHTWSRTPAADGGDASGLRAPSTANYLAEDRTAGMAAARAGEGAGERSTPPSGIPAGGSGMCAPWATALHIPVEISGSGMADPGEEGGSAPLAATPASWILAGEGGGSVSRMHNALVKDLGAVIPAAGEGSGARPPSTADSPVQGHGPGIATPDNVSTARAPPTTHSLAQDHDPEIPAPVEGGGMRAPSVTDSLVRDNGARIAAPGEGSEMRASWATVPRTPAQARGSGTTDVSSGALAPWTQ